MKIPSNTLMNPADFSRTLRRIKVPVGMSIEDVLTPGNWANIYAKVAVDDEVIVWREDRAWRLHLLVVEVGAGLVRTIVLHKADNLLPSAGLAPKEPETPLDPPSGYKVNHTPKTGWRVLTEDPHMEVSRNHRTKHEATLAAISHAAKAQGIAA